VTPNGATDLTHDRELFAHHAAWVASRLSWSPVDLALALHQRFDGSTADGWSNLARRLGMLSPDQRAAEGSLVHTLRMHRDLKQRFSRRGWSQSIDRRVDWPRTLEVSDLPIPRRYATAIRVEEIDTELTIQLAQLARAWWSILVDIDGERAAELEKAWRCHLPHTHSPSASLSPRMLARLAHSNALAAAAIARGAGARYSPIDPGKRQGSCRLLVYAA
jgi:hypothetical protein